MSIVDNQLSTLISLYEEEKIELQKMIEDCLADKEYLLAHYHSEALYKINRRLQTLKNIDDKLFDEKKFTQRTIERIQASLEHIQSLEDENLADMKTYYEKELKVAKEKSEKLNLISKPVAPSGSENLLNEMLDKLVENKIVNLKLILNKANNFILDFRYSDNVLKVTLPDVERHTKQWILGEDNIDNLNNLDFVLTEGETKLVLTLTGEKGDILKRLKIILSKVVFEVFYFKIFDNESYIEFN